MQDKVKTYGAVWNRDLKMFNSIHDRTMHCENCGHSILFENKKNKILCNHCGRYVFKNKKTEFEYRLKEQLLKR